MFELHQLRCFLAVGEELHFGRAALRLHMTQPPLSRQIQLLEHEIGVRLFDRTSRSVRLTPAGRALLPEAARLLRLAAAAAADARRVAAGEAGTLTLGFTGGAGYELLPRLVALLSAELPGIDLVLRELRTADQMEALAAGRLDAGLLRLPIDRTGLDLLCIARDRLLLAAPAAHPVARRRKPPTPQDLDGAPTIMFASAENRFLADLVAGLFRLAAVEPRIVQHVNQIHTALGLVSAGIGLAVVPESARFLAMRGVRLRPFDPEPPLRADLHFVWRRTNANPALATLRTRILPQLLP